MLETANKSNKALIEQTKKQAEKDVNVAKFAYKKAYEAGDAVKIVNAQERLTDAKMKLDKLSTVVTSLQEVETPVQMQETEAETPQVDDRPSHSAKEHTSFGSDEYLSAYAIAVPVSYSPLTLPTNRELWISEAP